MISASLVLLVWAATAGTYSGVSFIVPGHGHGDGYLWNFLIRTSNSRSKRERKLSNMEYAEWFVFCSC